MNIVLVLNICFLILGLLFGLLLGPGMRFLKHLGRIRVTQIGPASRTWDEKWVRARGTFKAKKGTETGLVGFTDQAVYTHRVTGQKMMLLDHDHAVPIEGYTGTGDIKDRLTTFASLLVTELNDGTKKVHAPITVPHVKSVLLDGYERMKAFTDIRYNQSRDRGLDIEQLAKYGLIGGSILLLVGLAGFGVLLWVASILQKSHGA